MYGKFPESIAHLAIRGQNTIYCEDRQPLPERQPHEKCSFRSDTHMPSFRGKAGFLGVFRAQLSTR